MLAPQDSDTSRTGLDRPQDHPLNNRTRDGPLLIHERRHSRASICRPGLSRWYPRPGGTRPGQLPRRPGAARCDPHQIPAWSGRPAPGLAADGEPLLRRKRSRRSRGCKRVSWVTLVTNYVRSLYQGRAVACPVFRDRSSSRPMRYSSPRPERASDESPRCGRLRFLGNHPGLVPASLQT